MQVVVGYSTKPEVVVASKEPFKVSLEPGKTYFWCACGRSKKQVSASSVSGYHDSCLCSHSVMAATKGQKSVHSNSPSRRLQNMTFFCVVVSTQTALRTVMVPTLLH